MRFSKTIFAVFILSFLSGSGVFSGLYGQAVPGKDENIPFLVTFGKEARTSWGDRNFYQIFFFTVPKDFRQQFFIRIFDPACGGEYDEMHGEFNTKTLFSVYGGRGVDPEKNEESKGLLPGLDYKIGNLLASKVFENDARYYNKYYAFGPFNPAEGDFNEKWNSYIFKIVCEGISGDDGNLYRYFLSREPDNNLSIEGANAFTYVYTFRLWNDLKSVSHIYPYIDTGIVSVKQRNFDWDNDGIILVFSRYKDGISAPVSGEDNWVESVISIDPQEVGSSLDFQLYKNKEKLIKNNNVVLTLQNQRGDALKFFSTPIGGIPIYQPSIKIQQKK